jgi:hypothetical protein
LADYRIRIDNFSKGMRQDYDSQIIGGNTIDFGYYAQNVNVDDGSLKRTKGQEVITASNTYLRTLMRYVKAGEEFILGVDDNGRMYKLEDISGNLTFTEIYAEIIGVNVDYTQYSIGDVDVMIFSDGGHAAKYYDGTTVTVLKNDPAQAAGGTNTAPTGDFIELYKERLWIADKDTDFLSFSTAFDPNDWTAPTAPVEEVNMHGGEIGIATWDGGKPVALKSMMDSLYIMKGKMIIRLVGSYPGDFSVAEVFHTLDGRVIPKTMYLYENICLFMTTNGIFMYDGVNVTELTHMVQEVFDTVSQVDVDNATACIYDGKYLLAIPTGAASNPNVVLEYDIKKVSFTVRKDIWVTSFLETDAYGLVFQDTNGCLFKYNTGEQYVNNPFTPTYKTIDSIYITPKIHLNDQKVKKYSSMVHFTGSGNGKIKITCMSDITRPTSVTVTLSATEKTYHIKLKNKGYILQYKFENVDGSDFTIKQPEFEIFIPE